MSSVPSTGDSRQRLSYLLPTFINFSLPNTRFDGPIWVRSNGNKQLAISAGFGVGIGATRGFIPYGKYARAALVFICSEAVRTRNPTISISDTYRGFMNQLGLTWNRANAEEAILQMQALVACTITLTTKGLSDLGEETVETERFVFSFKDHMVFNPDRSGAISDETESTIVLSADFMEMIAIKENRVPIRTEAWNYLLHHKSPMAADIYNWLAYRLLNLKHPSHISWEQLANQFGSRSGSKMFKVKFLKELASAKLVYPEANVSEFGEKKWGGSHGLVLKVSERASKAVWGDLPKRTRKMAQ